MALCFKGPVILVGWCIALCLPLAPITGTNTSLSLVQIIAQVWPSGAGFVLSNMGYAAIMSFLMLMLQSKGAEHGSNCAGNVQHRLCA